MTSFYGENRQQTFLVDEEENRISRANIDKWIFRFLLILIGFMPLIVMAHMKDVLSPIVSNISTISSGSKGDMFTFYKSVLVQIITIITGLLLLVKIIFMNGKIRKTVLNYFIGFFAIAIIVSTILSPNISIALTGQYNRTDGAITWLCYIALMFISMNIEYKKNAIRYVLFSLYPFVILNLIIISMNFSGHDLLQYHWAQKLVTAFLPEGAKLAENSQLLGTLNHGNYMSGMFSILALMFLTSAIVEKNIIIKICNFIISLFAVLVILMSLSTSGFLTVTCLLLLILWIAFKSHKKLISFGLIVVFCLFSAIGIHVLSSKNPKVWDESVGFFVSANPYTEKSEQASLKNIEMQSKSIFEGNTVYAAENKFELPNLPESGVGAGSGRVYIWSYVLDLVKDRPLFGYGLDTLVYNFPHYNIDSRANLETENVIVDKPHNMYIGILYGAGIFGFIAFMCVILFTFVKAIKEVFKYNQKSGLVVILGIAWLSFLFQAIFNDSLPGHAAPFFIVLGIMLSFLLNKSDLPSLSGGHNE